MFQHIWLKVVTYSRNCVRHNQDVCIMRMWQLQSDGSSKYDLLVLFNVNNQNFKPTLNDTIRWIKRLFEIILKSGSQFHILSCISHCWTNSNKANKQITNNNKNKKVNAMRQEYQETNIQPVKNVIEKQTAATVKTVKQRLMGK